MDYREFTKSTVITMEPYVFEMLQKTLVGEYLSFSILSQENITKEILAEKICDYFEKLELKSGKSFDKHLDAYLENLESIVGRWVAKVSQTKKNEDTPTIVPRARKYFDKALLIKNTKVSSLIQLVDYSRIMLCLYAAVISNQHKEIGNFDYAVSSLEPDTILAGMKTEQDSILKFKKNKFDIKELYCSDTCTFVITIILLYKILNDKIQGE